MEKERTRFFSACVKRKTNYCIFFEKVSKKLLS